MLVSSNLRLVAGLALEYRSAGLPIEDLVNEGCLGLMRAVRHYDPSREVRFFSYASFWVRRAMLRALADQVPLVRVSAYRRALDRDSGDPRRTLRSRRTVPLEEAPASTGGATPADRMVSPIESPETIAIRRETISRVRRALLDLEPRDRRVLELRFGLTGPEARTLHEVSLLLGVSRERVRQIEMRARALLRRNLHRQRPLDPR